MSRIKKKGLDYFPMNTDFIHDRLVRRVMKREGDAALAVLLEVFSYIYAGEGYYVRADNLFYEDLSANLYEKSADDVKRIITQAVEYGIFDAPLFSREGVLSTADIQRQYLFSTRRRSVSQIEPCYCLLADEDCEDDARKDDARKDDNVTIIPENAPEKPHSTAQHSTAQHSVAEEKKEYPLQSIPTEERGQEAGDEEFLRLDYPSEKSLTERNFAERDIAGRGIAERNPTEKSFAERSLTGRNLAERRSATRAPQRKEWTDEAIGNLQPPADGLDRNLDGLVYNLRMFRIPPAEQYAIICKSNFGVIGHPVWKGFYTLRESHGKIKMPGRYLLSLFH